VAVFAKPQRGPNLEIEGVWAEGSQRAEIPFPRISATRRRATLPHEHARRHSTLFHRCPLGHLPWPVSRCMCEVLRPGMCFERIQSDCDPLSVSSHRFSLESCRLIVLACRAELRIKGTPESSVDLLWRTLCLGGGRLTTRSYGAPTVRMLWSRRRRSHVPGVPRCALALGEEAPPKRGGGCERRRLASRNSSHPYP
jgi:hypothetical protein